MGLESGHNLLHYRLLEPIGEGGMGVVWKAVDTALDREVAIKVLPAAFAADPERLARFEREARLLASLNHPNIAAIYGFHHADDTHFLAMELVDGEDLQQRLRRGPLPLDEALRIALEIARGFEAAHARGIIHRDLKPANVTLTRDGGVKVLDFGLAKALAPSEARGASEGGPSPMSSPTITSAGTLAGTILGTAAYMSPEQAKGKPVDRRTDIWSFGVVLYELVAGRRLFDSETVSETLAAVLMTEPDWGSLPASTPPGVRRLLRRCLTREPQDRLQDIGEARIALQTVIAGDDDAEDAAPDRPTTSGARRAIAWVAAGVLVGLAAGWFLTRAPTPTDEGPRHAMRFVVDTPDDISSYRNVATAPDDRFIVYQRSDVDGSGLQLHDFTTGEERLLEGTEGASQPFVSPDGQWVGYKEDDDLMKLRVAGGDAVRIATVSTGFPGATWGADGTILVPRGWLQGLWRVPADGGEPAEVTRVDTDAGEKGHWWPRFLPDGRHALFTIWRAGAGLIDSEVAVLDVRTGEYRTLVPGADAHFLPPGYLVFYRAGNYHAVAFDPATRRIDGDPVIVLTDATDPAPQGTNDLGVAISARGTLYYSTRQVNPEARLAIVRPGAKPEELDVAARSFTGFVISPDGRTVAAASLEAGVHVIRLIDLQTGTDERLDLPGSNWDPAWRPDGSGFAFLTMRKGDFDIHFVDLHAGGASRPLRVTPTDEQPLGWTADGSGVFVNETAPDGGSVMKVVAADDPDAEPVTVGSLVSNVVSVSPDGGWIAYDDTRGGAENVYVRPYPGPGAEVRVSVAGGARPAWSPDGRELYFERGRSIVAVPYTVQDGRFRPGREEVAFESPLLANNINATPISVLGRRTFLVTMLTEPPARPRVHVVLDWNREVAARLAAQ